MGVVHQSIEDGIGKRVVTNGFVPLIGGQLADADSGCAPVPIVHDFH